MRNMTNKTSKMLKQRFNARMEQLGLSPTALAAEAGVTVQGLMHLRNGKIAKYQIRTTGPVCAALYWTPDSITRLMAGKEAIEIPQPAKVDTSAEGLHNRLTQVELALNAAMTRGSEIEAKRVEILGELVERLEAVAKQLTEQA
jgi:DNA-binding Xre family transcriptional regulator